MFSHAEGEVERAIKTFFRVDNTRQKIIAPLSMRVNSPIQRHVHFSTLQARRKSYSVLFALVDLSPFAEVKCSFTPRAKENTLEKIFYAANV